MRACINIVLNYVSAICKNVKKQSDHTGGSGPTVTAIKVSTLAKEV